MIFGTINSNNYTMKTKFNGILTLLLAFVVQMSFAQQKTITGTVTDSQGPLPGVSIVVKGGTTGTETDFDGKYSIKANTGATLVFRYLGYKVVEKKVGNSTTINVKLEEDANVLEEVVVTGYSTMAKRKQATASTQISAETVENRPNASMVQTLAGQVAGLDISTNSGQPGANSLVQLRGVNSINGNTEPLFILDGTPIDEDNFRSLNQNEIESITVLKDAGATAIYGSRGANGVIIIKTRRGKAGSPLKVQYTGIYSVASFPGNRYDLMDAQEYATIERLRGTGVGAGDSVGPLFTGNNGPLTDDQINQLQTFDWLGEFTRNATTQNHTLNLSGGSENLSQFTSLGYFEQEGVLIDSNLKRFNLRNNLNGNSDRFSYNTSVSLNYSKNDSPGSIGTSGINRNPFFGAYSALPYLDPDGVTDEQLNNNIIFPFSPYMIANNFRTQFRTIEELRLLATVGGTYNITDEISANLTTGVDYTSTHFLFWSTADNFSEVLFNPTSGGFNTQNNRRRVSLNTTANITWNKTIDKHTIGAGVFSEYFKAHLRDFGFDQQGVNDKTFVGGDDRGFIDDNQDNDLFVPTVFANKRDAGLFSYFANVTYDYDSRFGFEATIRRDASYRFATTNRWGTFGSVSGRWNIDAESWMADSAINSLKLRASYGTTGNQRIAGGNYWSAPDLAFNFFGTGVSYAGQNSIFLSQLGNDTLQWETVAQFNVGVDFGVWNNRLRGSIDYYRKTTSDLFQSLPVSAVTSVTSISANTGKLHNNGVDVDVRYDLIRNSDLRLEVFVNGNYNKNYLDEIPREEGEIIGIGRNGGPLGEIFAVRYAGVNPANGNVLFLDSNDQLTETPDPDGDRVWTGLNSIPESQGGFGFNLDYKGFFVQTQFNYVIGVDGFDADYANFMDPNDIGTFQLSNDLFRAWTPDNRVTDVPSIQGGSNVAQFGSTRFLADRDHIRLRFAAIGYSMPQSFLDSTGLSSLRFFANGENLFTLTKFRGYDAASRTSGRTYPTPTTISFGIELGL